MADRAMSTAGSTPPVFSNIVPFGDGADTMNVKLISVVVPRQGRRIASKQAK
jgi:hypothetical protein